MYCNHIILFPLIRMPHQVGSNGQVSFREGTGRFDIHFPTTPPLVTAFWADINPIIGGTIFHRVINSGPELEDLSTNLSGFQCEQFEPTSAAVVTFERVSRFGGSSDIVSMEWCDYNPIYVVVFFAAQHFPSDPHD